MPEQTPPAKPGQPVERAGYRVGTRGSPLARAQAEIVIEALATAHGLDRSRFETIILHTSGDQVRDRPIAEIGGKGVWARELDQALLTGMIDFAVHSLKDLETELAPGIVIAAVPPRADPRDRLIGAGSLDSLPKGATVGTSSPRRAALVQNRRPDIRVVNLRGNVGTRLQRIEEGAIDATFLAAAGLDRLAIDIGTPLDPQMWPPAVAQGAIAVTARRSDEATQAFLSPICDRNSRLAIETERAFLAALGGSCHSAVGIHARTGTDGRLNLIAELLSTDGRESLRATSDFPAGERVVAATRLAVDMLGRASPAIRASFSPGPA